MLVASGRLDMKGARQPHHVSHYVQSLLIDLHNYYFVTPVYETAIIMLGLGSGELEFHIQDFQGVSCAFKYLIDTD